MSEQCAQSVHSEGITDVLGIVLKLFKEFGWEACSVAPYMNTYSAPICVREDYVSGRVIVSAGRHAVVDHESVTMLVLRMVVLTPFHVPTQEVVDLEDHFAQSALWSALPKGRMEGVFLTEGEEDGTKRKCLYFKKDVQFLITDQKLHATDLVRASVRQHLADFITLSLELCAVVRTIQAMVQLFRLEHWLYGSPASVSDEDEEGEENDEELSPFDA